MTSAISDRNHLLFFGADQDKRWTLSILWLKCSDTNRKHPPRSNMIPFLEYSITTTRLSTVEYQVDDLKYYNDQSLEKASSGSIFDERCGNDFPMSTRQPVVRKRFGAGNHNFTLPMFFTIKIWNGDTKSAPISNGSVEESLICASL